MTASEHNMDDLLARVAGGRLDELTSEQVAALELHLNATPAAAELLENVAPPADPLISHQAPSPSEAEWEAVWERVDSTTSAGGRPTAPGIRRVMRLWQPLAAAAACILLIVFWRAIPSPTETPWEIQLSDDVVVHELEVFGNDSAFIAYSDDNGGGAVIWVFEETEELKGV